MCGVLLIKIQKTKKQKRKKQAPSGDGFKRIPVKSHRGKGDIAVRLLLAQCLHGAYEVYNILKFGKSFCVISWRIVNDAFYGTDETMNQGIGNHCLRNIEIFGRII